MDTYENEQSGGKKTLWIIGGIVLVIAIVGVIYGATQRTIKNTSSEENAKLNDRDTAVNGAELDANREAVPVAITGFDVVNMQTFPNRVQVRVRGTVPNGCSVASMPTATLSGKVFTVSMEASKDRDAICTQVVTNVEGVVELPVSGLAAGTYTVTAGGTTKTFALAETNSVQFISDK